MSRFAPMFAASVLIASAAWAQSSTAPFIDGQPIVLATTAPGIEPAPLAQLPTLIEVELRLDRRTLPVGSPVMGEFVVRNRTNEPVTLAVPGATVGGDPFLGMGLPLEHVFSGERFRALRVEMEDNPTLGDRMSLVPEYPVPLLTIAPLASIGLKFDLARFYPVLHQAGRYLLTWSPYGGAVIAPPVALLVENYKVAVIETDKGRMRLRLLYDKAPRTVENFLELVSGRFYDGKRFHRLQPGFVLAGGDPNADGTGRRPDGVLVPPEFNDTPFDEGTVGMSLVEGNPNSASCQFFITLSRVPSLDGRYTAFAQIDGPESLETLRKLASVSTDAVGRPTSPLVIKTAVTMDAPAGR